MHVRMISNRYIDADVKEVDGSTWRLTGFYGEPSTEDFFIFNIFFKLFLKLILFFFFKTNTFGRACLHGVANSRCRTIHGGAAGGSQRLCRPLTWQV